ncbi:MAG: hypothetical protein JWM53_7146 [bacterium]|nr:hypothetical protein [bacterium]
MKYVDGYVLPVPKKNLQAYRRMAQKAGKVWREHGALEFRECVGDDLKVKIAISFPRTIQAQAWRDGGFFLDRIQVARASRRRQRQSHERPATRENDGSEIDAVRLEANGLRGFQRRGRRLDCLAERRRINYERNSSFLILILASAIDA